jgi:hypothetical protein
MSTLTVFEIIPQDKNILIRHKDTQRTFVFVFNSFEFNSFDYGGTIKKLKTKLLNGDFSYILNFESFTIMVYITIKKTLFSRECHEQIVTNYAEDDIVLMKRELAYLRYKVLMFEQQDQEPNYSDCEFEY